MASGTMKMDESYKKTTFSLNLPSGYSVIDGHAFQLGNLVFIGGVISLPSAVTLKRIQLNNIIPSAYVSPYRIDFAANNNSSDEVLHGIIQGTSLNFYRPDTSNIQAIGFSVIYPLI